MRLAEQQRPDIVLMDLALKEMDGLKASLRIAKACPATHVIILTNYAFDDLKNRARDMYGVSAFLGKEEISTRLLPTIRSLRTILEQQAPNTVQDHGPSISRKQSEPTG